MARKGALAKDPPKKQTPQKSNKPATGGQNMQFKHAENKAAYEGMTPQQQARYRKILANKGRGAANQFMGKASGKQVVMPGKKPPGQQPAGPPNEPPPGVPFEQLSPEQQMGEMADVGGQMYNQMAGYSSQFNPETFQQQYEGQFQGAMDRARQSVMSQFEQRNAQQFAQERQDFETAMANKGIAPGGAQYNRELQAMTDRQDRARQEAMNAAEQAAQGVQQQAYQQATGIAMMPGEIQQQYQAPVLAQYGQYGNMQQQQLQGQQQMALQKLQGQQQLAAIRATPRGGGGGGGGGMDPFQQYMLAQTMGRYDQGNPQPNTGAQFVQGVTQGGTLGVTNYMNRK